MKTYRLEGDPHEAEMVECEFGEYVKLEEIDDETLLKSTDLLAQMIRREIATLEWATACANHDLQKYGEWQCNWVEHQEEVQRTLDRLISRANS